MSLVLTRSGLGQGDELGGVDAAPPSADQLREIAHWVAPPRVPVRFDARYFAVRGIGGTRTRARRRRDRGRVVGLAGAGSCEDWTAGRRRLYWPTFFTVTEISGCRSVDDLFGLTIVTREPDDDELERLPRSTFWQD